MKKPRLSGEHQNYYFSINRSTNFFLSLFNGIADAIFVKNRQHQWVFVNDACCQLLGRDRQEVLGKCELDFFLPSEAEAFSDIDELVFVTGQTKENHGFFTDAAGKRRVISSKKSLFQDGDGNQFLVGIIRDVTESIVEYQKVEAESIESKQLLQLVIDNIPQMIGWKDGNSVFLGCNQEFAKAAGLEEPSQIIGKTDYDLAWEKHESDWYRECDRRVMDSGVAELHIIETQRQASGKKVWLDTNKIPLFDRSNQVVGILVTIEDITQKYLNQQHIFLQNAIMRLLATAASLEEVASQVLQAIGYHLDWQIGECWLMESSATSISCLASWQSEDYTVANCVRHLEKIARKPGMVLAQEVMNRGEAISIDCLSNSDSELCKLFDCRNLREIYSLLAFPIIHAEKIIGVITLLGFHKYQKEANSLDILNVIGKLLGEFVARKEAENALMESESKLQKLADSIPGMLYQFQLDADGIMSFPYISSGCQKIFDLNPEQIQSDPTLSIKYINPNEREKYLNSIMESAQNLSPWKYEFSVNLPNAQQKWLQGMSHPEKLPDGSVLWHGIVVDITRLKSIEVELQQAYAQMEALVLERTKELAQTNDALQERERQYRGLVETSQNIIWSINTDYKFTFVNSAVKTVYGYEIEELIGSSLLDLFAPPQIQEATSQFKRVLNGESLHHYEVIHLDRSGKKLYLLMNAIALYGDNGKVIGITGTTADITAIKAAQTERDRFFQVSKDLLCTIGKDGFFKQINPAFTSVLGYTISELYSLPLIDFIHPDDRDRTIGEIFRAKDSNSSQAFENRCRCRDGSYKWLLWSAIVDEQTGLTYASARDITERKLAEQRLRLQTEELEIALDELQRTQIQLVQSEKMSSLGQLVAGIAHEINNPINFIYANICYIEEYTNNLIRLAKLYHQYFPESNSTIREFSEAIELEYIKTDLPQVLTSIKHGSERIRQIVLSLRNFSRLDEAKIKRVDIHEGINSTLLILQNALNNCSNGAIKIITKYDDLPLVECYAGKLNQVFMNIITNAIDAVTDTITEKESKFNLKNQKNIQIITENKQQSVVIKIIDNGVGIPEDVRSRIFDPFFTTKTVGKGTGLGLSISYQIVVELHQGQLRCISEVGQGTEFQIEIPTKFGSLQ